MFLTLLLFTFLRLIYNTFRRYLFQNGVEACSRSSLPEVFCKKGALRNFAKFTGKYLCQSLFLNKVAGLRPETL